MIARAALVIGLSIFLSSFAAACGDAPTESECAKLMDHLIEIEMGEGGAQALSPEVAKDKGAVKKRVMGYLEEDFMKSCKKSLPKSQLECGLRAKTFAEVSACDEG